MFALLLVIVGTGLLLVGPVAAYFGHGLAARNAVVAETPVTPVRELAEPGTVAVHGEVRPVDEPVTSPFGGEPCVATTWRVRDWDDRDRGMWLTEAEGALLGRFELDDGTGTVRVDPGENPSQRLDATNAGDLGMSATTHSVTVDGRVVETPRPRTVAEVGIDEEPPERAAAFERRTDAVPERSGSITNVVNVGHAHGDRQYEEAPIPAGTELYVLGELVPRDGEATARLRPETAVVEPGDGDPGFLVSVRSPERLRSSGRAAGLLFRGGVAATVLGVAALAGGLLLL